MITQYINAFTTWGNLLPMAHDIKFYFKNRGKFGIVKTGYGPIYSTDLEEALYKIGLDVEKDYLVTEAIMCDHLNMIGDKYVSPGIGEWRSTRITPFKGNIDDFSGIIIYEDQATKTGRSALSGVVKSLYLINSGDFPPVEIQLALNGDAIGIANYTMPLQQISPLRYGKTKKILAKLMLLTYEDLGSKYVKERCLLDFVSQKQPQLKISKLSHTREELTKDGILQRVFI